jgi:hypothetical protein
MTTLADTVYLNHGPDNYFGFTAGRGAAPPGRPVRRRRRLCRHRAHPSPVEVTQTASVRRSQ